MVGDVRRSLKGKPEPEVYVPHAQYGPGWSMTVLRGAAETRSPIMIAGIGYWVIGVPIGYLVGFPLGLGPVGVWTGLAVAAVLLAARVRDMLWQRPFRNRAPAGCSVQPGAA